MEHEIDYGALFGVDLGENEQEVADPVEDQTNEAQGEEEQEVADPVVDNENPQETDGAEDTATEEDIGSEDTDKPAQSKKDRARYAAARRKAEAERDAAIARAKEEMKADAAKLVDEAFANSGLMNPYTKQPIKSKAEYDAYKAQYEAEQTARVQKKSGMSETEFKEFIDGLPEVKAAKEAARAASEREAQAHIAEQIREIHALDPSIHEVKDLQAMENYQQFYNLVKRGNTFVDAFKLVNFDKLSTNRAAAAKQAAANSTRSKEHLTHTTTRGAGAVSVPQDVKDAYRVFNPNATDAEIQKHYQNYLQK